MWKTEMFEYKYKKYTIKQSENGSRVMRTVVMYRPRRPSSVWLEQPCGAVHWCKCHWTKQHIRLALGRHMSYTCHWPLTSVGAGIPHSFASSSFRYEIVTDNQSGRPVCHPCVDLICTHMGESHRRSGTEWTVDVTCPGFTSSTPEKTEPAVVDDKNKL